MFLGLQLAQLLSKAVDDGQLTHASETISLTGHTQNDLNLAVIAGVGFVFRIPSLGFQVILVKGLLKNSCACFYASDCSVTFMVISMMFK